MSNQNRIIERAFSSALDDRPNEMLSELDELNVDNLRAAMEAADFLRAAARKAWIARTTAPRTDVSA